jgi:hypothetical protein
MRWPIVLGLLPVLAWLVVYATFSAAAFEDTCMRALDVDTSPIACVPTWFLVGAAGCILLFQWGFVTPLVLWLQRRIRRNATVAAAARLWLVIATSLLVGAALARTVFFESDALRAAMYATVAQFCLPLVILLVPSVLLFTVPSAAGASDSRA